MNSISRPARWKRPTIRSACICAKWARFRLLTREGEVEIAKRIERGQLRVLKALSRSPIVIREILAMGEDLKRGVRSIKEVVVFDEEEITDEILQNRLKDTTGKVDELNKHYRKAMQLAAKFAGDSLPRTRSGRASIAKSVGPSAVSRWKSPGRFGSWDSPTSERKHLIDRVNKTVDSMKALDKQIQNLENRVAAHPHGGAEEGTAPAEPPTALRHGAHRA